MVSSISGGMQYPSGFATGVTSAAQNQVTPEDKAAVTQLQTAVQLIDASATTTQNNPNPTMSKGSIVSVKA